jgi:hypothetical protein
MARQSAVVGVGYSKILRDKGIDGRPLAVEASRTAIADAGLTVGDVDAVFALRCPRPSTGASPSSAGSTSWWRTQVSAR